jgi:nucleoside 2-deoxyribosyltransferase
MKIYVAGPLFTQADRDFLEACAAQYEAAGIDCFVPHRETLEPLTPDTVYRVDGDGVRGAHALVAWLDGPVIDDGTACEVGIFAELCRREPTRYLGMVGLVTDWRTMRRRSAGAVADGLNLFVVGAIRAHGEIAYDVDRVVEILSGWKERLTD